MYSVNVEWRLKGSTSVPKVRKQGITKWDK